MKEAIKCYKLINSFINKLKRNSENMRIWEKIQKSIKHKEISQEFKVQEAWKLFGIYCD